MRYDVSWLLNKMSFFLFPRQFNEDWIWDSLKRDQYKKVPQIDTIIEQNTNSKQQTKRNYKDHGEKSEGSKKTRRDHKADQKRKMSRRREGMRKRLLKDAITEVERTPKQEGAHREEPWTRKKDEINGKAEWTETKAEQNNIWNRSSRPSSQSGQHSKATKSSKLKGGTSQCLKRYSNALERKGRVSEKRATAKERHLGSEEATSPMKSASSALGMKHCVRHKKLLISKIYVYYIDLSTADEQSHSVHLKLFDVGDCGVC